VQPRIVEIRQNVLRKNDELARALRARFLTDRVLVVNLVSSPGSGKTAWLERSLGACRTRGWHTAVLVGDVATDNDARRLAATGVPVRQIGTGGLCHLDAQMIVDHLRDWPPRPLDLLFIENVGNLVCPASYDLGESLRAVLLSTTEGEDKPLKYPALFHSADVALLTKLDLAAACEFDHAAARQNLQAARPGIRVVETSARTGQGLDDWLDLLDASRQQVLAAGPAPPR
jgi:hydrogenase nickel incorporation protein HypB